MNEYPVKMLFMTSISRHGVPIIVDVLGPNERIPGGLYIRYPDGGTDTTVNDFLFALPNEIVSIQLERDELRARVAELEDALVWAIGKLSIEAPVVGGNIAYIRAFEKASKTLGNGTSKPFILREQAEAVARISENMVRPMTKEDMVRVAELLRQQADDIEKGGEQS